MHVAVYYSTTPNAVPDGIACIGRASGRFHVADAICSPSIEWEHDPQPVICSNSAASMQWHAEIVTNASAGARFNSSGAWREHSGGEALAHGAEPFYGLDGSVYLVYGAHEPGDIRIVQLNESSGRLPFVAQPGHAPGSASVGVYHHAAAGPNFVLGADERAPPDSQAAYLGGKVKLSEQNNSIVQNAFVLPTRRNRTAEYFLFVEWFGGVKDAVNESSTSRIYVGRSRVSPTGPFYDRIGNRMSHRYEVLLGDERTISIVSARWGANCNGLGYDVSAVAKLYCEGQPYCDWVLRYQELDSIDPHSYSHFDFPPAAQTHAKQFGDAANNFADQVGCAREMQITYQCSKHAAVLYDSEMADAVHRVFVEAEAANGSVAHLRCESPSSVLVPGGSLFADPQRLGGNLHFTTVGHSGVFAYKRGKELVHVFTFQYQTMRSATPELGARRIRFASDGWPVLEQDHEAQWARCGEPEAIYSRVAPHSYFATEAHINPDEPLQAHYGGSSSTRTHCRHHEERGTHCVGDSLRATHPQIGIAGAEGSLLHGQIETEGSAGWWREQQDHCNPLIETLLGKKLVCTRFAGKGDLNPAKHVSTMERIRGCPRLACERKFACRQDPKTRAAAGTLDSCTEALQCKKLPELRVIAWDSTDFFENGTPVETTRDGLVLSLVARASDCHASAHISRIDPGMGFVYGGSAVTVYGTGFGAPARCRFGWLESFAYNITAHRMVCKVPSLNDTVSTTSVHGGPRGVPLVDLMRVPVILEVSMMTNEALARTPLPVATRLARGDNFTNDRHAFQFYDHTKIFVSFLRPQGGPTLGSTHVDVHGAGFWPSDANSNIKCRFSSAPGRIVVVQATYHNSERVSCFSPSHTSNTRLDFDITFDEQQYVGAGASFTFYTLHNMSTEDAAAVVPSVMISSINPIGGPARGGTIITLLGRGFAPLDDPGDGLESFANRELHKLNDGHHDLHRSVILRHGLFCLFKDVDAIVHGASVAGEKELRRSIIPATAADSGQLVCVTPRFGGFAETSQVSSQALHREVPVAITLNGNPAERTESKIAFTYYRDDRHLQPKLHRVQPFGGPAEGGTVVTIRMHSAMLRLNVFTPFYLLRLRCNYVAQVLHLVSIIALHPVSDNLM